MTCLSATHIWHRKLCQTWHWKRAVWMNEWMDQEGNITICTTYLMTDTTYDEHRVGISCSEVVRGRYCISPSLKMASLTDHCWELLHRVYECAVPRGFVGIAEVKSINTRQLVFWPLNKRGFFSLCGVNSFWQRTKWRTNFCSWKLHSNFLMVHNCMCWVKTKSNFWTLLWTSTSRSSRKHVHHRLKLHVLTCPQTRWAGSNEFFGYSSVVIWELIPFQSNLHCGPNRSTMEDNLPVKNWGFPHDAIHCHLLSITVFTLMLKIM